MENKAIADENMENTPGTPVKIEIMEKKDSSEKFCDLSSDTSIAVTGDQASGKS